MPLEDSSTMEDTMDDDGRANSEFVHDFRSLGQDLDKTKTTDWLESDCHDQGYEHLDDNAIADLVNGSDQVQEVDSDDDSETVDEPCPISHRDAADMLNKCLTWLQHQTEATPCNTSVLLSLKDIAAKKRYSSMKQKTITSFLNEPN